MVLNGKERRGDSVLKISGCGFDSLTLPLHSPVLSGSHDSCSSASNILATIVHTF